MTKNNYVLHMGIYLAHVAWYYAICHKQNSIMFELLIMMMMMMIIINFWHSIEIEIQFYTCVAFIKFDSTSENYRI